MSSVPFTCGYCTQPLPFGVLFCPHCGHQQTSTTGSLWMGDRRLVTILFADLASFTATSENADPEDVIDMLNQVFTRLAVEYDREGGYLDKTVGDQLMVLFGAPRAHEDDPVRAVRAALGMQQAMEELAPTMREKVGHAFKLNIGINTGIVVWGKMGPAGRMAATVIGDDVNLASRLESHASNGQILVSDPVYALTRRYFEYDILKPIRVKGKKNPIPIYQPLHLRKEFDHKKQRQDYRAPLVERDLELQTMHAHLSLAMAGKCQLLLLCGEAGIGKSRMLTEFAGEIENYSYNKKPITLQSYGVASSGGDYSPLQELLLQLFDIKTEDTRVMQRRKIEDRAQILGFSERDFVPLMGYFLGWYHDDARLDGIEHTLDQVRKSAIYLTVSLFLKQATRRPLVVIIDNLQWADANSLEWLKLLGAVKSSPTHAQSNIELLLLAASRPQLEIPLESFNPSAIVKLMPLSNHARRDLIASLLPGGELPGSLVDRLISESGGNPFYLEEAARGLVQSEQLVRQDGQWRLTRSVEEIYIPHSIEGQVMAHLDILDESSRMVLQHASVIGMTFNYELLGAIISVKDFDRTLENLLQRGLITETTVGEETNRTFIFSQMVVREVAYKSMLRKSRRELHEKIVTLTEEAQSRTAYDNNSVESLARHYRAGGQEHKVIVYNWLVGQRALENFQFTEACHHLGIALNTLKELPTPETDTFLQVANALGDACTFAGEFGQAGQCYKMVWEIAKNNPEELFNLYYRTGRLNLFQGNTDAASTSYQYAQNIGGDDPPLTAQIHAEIRLMYDLD